MIVYTRENKGQESLYEFFYNRLREDILNGRIKSGEKLPSKRDFAAANGVSVITVENAYGQLAAEGYIFSKPKSGYYASDVGKTVSGSLLFPKKDFTDNIFTEKNSKEKTFTEKIFTKNSLPENSLLKNSLPENSLPEKYTGLPASSGFLNNSIKSPETGSRIKEDTCETISLVSGSASVSSFPFSVWAKINRKILTEGDSKLLTSPPAGGVPELRSAISVHLREFRGINVSPDQIIIGAGTEYLYMLIVSLLGREKKYGLENPGSVKIRNIYRSLGTQIVPLMMDDEGITTNSLNGSGAEIIQISPSHHFPTGIVTSAGRRFSLLQWVGNAPGRYIIEDDYDTEFRLQGRPIPSMFSMDTTGHVIYLNTFSKSLASTVRISYMVLPPALLEEYMKKLSFYSCTVSNFEQYVLADFIKDRHFEKHINRIRNRSRNLRDELIKLIRESTLSGKVRISEENSGLHFLLHIDSSESDSELKAGALKAGLEVSFLSEYTASCEEYGPDADSKSRTAIISYSGLSRSGLPEVVKRMEKAWS